MKNLFFDLSDYYSPSYVWLYLQFTGDTPGFSSVSPTKKMSAKSGQIYRKDAQWSEMNGKSIFWFLRFLFFELLSILYSKFIDKLTNFEYKNDHISKTKYRKNPKMIFLSFQHIPQPSCKYEHLWHFAFFFLEKHLEKIGEKK